MQNIANVLDALGVVNFGADLVGGKIHWTNKEGEIVAFANVKAIMSWAATNNSAMWAHAVGQFQDAGVPCVVPKDAISEYISNINDEQAAEFAQKVAAEAGAQFLYRAANGANGLYLAIFDFEEGTRELTTQDITRRRRSAIGYVVQMLGNLAEILNNKKREQEAVKLLEHFQTALKQQVEQVLKDEDVITEAKKLDGSMSVWISKILAGERKDVLAFMKQAISKWQRML